MSTPFILLLAAFVGLSLARVPLALSMIVAGFVYLQVSHQDLGIATDQIMNSLYNNYVLLAVPMFILAANVMNAGTISKRLWGAADAAVGHLHGGLGHVTVLVSVAFSSMSGSALADAAGPGLVALKMMREVGGFRPGFAAALTAAAATIAPIIPPSIPLVLYALNSDASVGALFLGGVVPGLIMALSLMATVAIVARRTGLGRRPWVGWAAFGKAMAGAGIPMTIPVVLLGGIWSGVFTPTEAAAIAGIYALLVSVFVYRAYSWATLWAVLVESMRSSSVVMLLIAGAFLINYAVTAEQLDKSLAAWIIGAKLTPSEFLLAINVVFLFLGCLIDTGTLILILVPLLLPTIKILGIDLVHFGVLITINIMIGLITPPFGLLLFTLAKLGDVRIEEVVGEIWPFIAALLVALAITTMVPATVLWLPTLAGFR
jgi:tripartite ATP-independent transporter DctM subunit